MALFGCFVFQFLRALLAHFVCLKLGFPFRLLFTLRLPEKPCLESSVRVLRNFKPLLQSSAFWNASVFVAEVFLGGLFDGVSEVVQWPFCLFLAWSQCCDVLCLLFE